MKHLLATSPKLNTALLVALATPKQPLPKAQEYLEELRLLCDTLHIKTVKIVIQQLKVPHPKTLVGKGKLEEIKTFIQATPVDKIIFDDELTPSQARNIEKFLEQSVIDRTNIILEIFAMRAQTNESKLQVELAQYQYLLPRLKRMWTHLSRQQGGVAGMRGPGEKELETDRRIVQNKVSLLRKKLALVDKQRHIQRQYREGVIRIALVGYTNAGKSTLMQLLAHSQTYVEDKLFATITSTVRRTMIQDMPCLLTDTVGFIRKLPHHLIVSFKSTLDEICQANLLLHIIDVSHPACKDHIAVVQKTLEEIGAAAVPVLFVFNKIDQLVIPQTSAGQAGEISSLEVLQQEYNTMLNREAVFISAKNKNNIDQLKDFIYRKIQPLYLANPSLQADTL